MQRQHDRAEHKALGEMQPDHAKAAINDADKFRVQTDLFAGDAEDDDKAADDIAFLAAGGKTDADRLAEGISPLSH